MSTGFVFPGQGSQAVGMGRALAEAFGSARLVFEEIDDALGQRLSRLMFEGPEADLTLTENAQPALMAVSLAVLAVLESEGGFKLSDKAAFVAGHSLGEYTALAAAGALTLPDAARLLKRRGLAMQRAVPVGAGAMAALLGLDLPVAEEVAAAAAEGEVCACANDNAPGQVVVSGDRAAVERAVTIAGEKGAKRSGARIILGPTGAALAPVPAPAEFEPRVGKRREHQPGEYEFGRILPVGGHGDVVIAFETLEKPPRALIRVQAAAQSARAPTPSHNAFFSLITRQAHSRRHQILIHPQQIPGTDAPGHEHAALSERIVPYHLLDFFFRFRLVDQQPAAVVGERPGHGRFTGFSETHQVFAMREAGTGRFCSCPACIR